MQALSAHPALDLSPLYRAPVFTSQSPQESRRLLGRELVEHELEWRRGAVDTAFFRGEICRHQLFVLRYGAEVEVRPRPFDDFVLMQMPLRGRAVFQCDGQRLEVGAGQVALLAPQREVRLHWSKDCEQLMVKLPRELLQHALGRYPMQDRPAALPALMAFDGAQSAIWMRLVSALLAQMESPLMAAPWAEHLEASLPQFLLSQLPRVDTTGVALASDPTLRRWRKVEALMRARLENPPTLEELAGSVGLSVRSLNSLVRKHRGEPPMEYLRNLRLDEARRRLQRSGVSSVTVVALELGFSHLGRFAEHYRRRFGETPRETGSAPARAH